MHLVWVGPLDAARATPRCLEAGCHRASKSMTAQARPAESTCGRPRPSVQRPISASHLAAALTLLLKNDGEAHACIAGPILRPGGRMSGSHAMTVRIFTPAIVGSAPASQRSVNMHASDTGIQDRVGNPFRQGEVVDQLGGNSTLVQDFTKHGMPRIPQESIPFSGSSPTSSPPIRRTDRTTSSMPRSTRRWRPPRGASARGIP